MEGLAIVLTSNPSNEEGRGIGSRLNRKGEQWEKELREDDGRVRKGVTSKGGRCWKETVYFGQERL